MTRALFLLAVVLTSAVAAVDIASGSTHERAGLPTAAEFGRDFVALSNRFAADHGDGRRISDPDCVQASPGAYMCSFASTRPGGPRQCHLMQARWTPRRESTITVTLGGRTKRCGSLREAIASLR